MNLGATVMAPFSDGSINGETFKTVNARDLHEFLGVRSSFKDWIARRVSDYAFEEGKDFCSFLSVNRSRGRPSKEYHISLDMAKELSMVERTEKGKEARQYFIDCELRAKESALSSDRVHPELPDFTDPIASARAWADEREKVNSLTVENKQYAIKSRIQTEVIETLEPKADEYDAYLSEEGVVEIRPFCSKHDVKVNHVGKTLRKHHLMMQLRTEATQVGVRSGLVKNVVEKSQYAYIGKCGNIVEAHRAMIVKDREVDVLRLIIRTFGIAAFRNELAFARALRISNLENVA